ncbi:MAG: hypothetical protein ABS87_09775 [Sphingomonas sp. SCN 67-18]|mgnify:CR=1 FL=1|uniref:hypothetical protein n=1 Tax=uncultured Sphingomonas sp. TaxID=158754 RepID=UPI00086A53B4|nr:hypothetical protein [Sphingomonas sp. SCN 67-18]ODU20623.1 MAG: hypothetical protein ABS87_09775 [Sphingomonas sp. SCN 67-18]
MTAGLVVRAGLYAVAATVISALLTVAWVLTYAAAVNPGQSAAAYQAYAVEAAPTITLAIGVPLLLLAGWLIARGRDRRSGLIAALLIGIFFVLIDFVLLLGFSANQAIPWGPIGMSYAIKVGAAALGGLLGNSRAALETGEDTTI